MTDSLEEFLVFAAALEKDAAEGYAQLSASMKAAGNDEVAALFERFGGFCDMHHADVLELQRKELGRTLDKPASEIQWPDGHSPESPLALAGAEVTTARAAMEMALEVERRACDFYSAVANQTRSERVQELAQEFAEEEAEHVAHLERWLAGGNPAAG